MAGWLGWLKKKPHDDGAKKSAQDPVLQQHELDIERGRFERIVALLTASSGAPPEVGRPETIEELRAARVRLATLDARAAGLEAASEAERLASEIGDMRERAVLLMRLCGLHARAGESSTLRGLLEQVTTLFKEGDFDPSSLAHYLGRASKTLASDAERSNSAEIARCVGEIVDACADPERRIAALSEFVSARVLAGDLDGARGWLARIDDDYWNWDARATLAEAQCQAGDIAGAQATAEPIRDKSIRDRVTKALAGAFARAGDDERGVAQIELIQDEALRGDATFDVALARAQRGDDEAVRELIESSEDGPPRWNALGQLAVSQLERGDLASATATADEIEDPEWRESTQADFVGVLLARAQLDDARQMAETIETPSLRMRALRRVADHLAPQQHDEKLRLLELALKAATNDRSRPASDGDAAFMAGMFVDVGKLDLACEVFAAMATTPRRDEILQTIAAAVAASGEAAEVEKLLARFNQPADRARILIAAADGAMRRAAREHSAPAQPA